MSTVVKNTKVLVVDTSPAMLEVLKNFSNKHGYDMDSHSDPADAAEALNGRVQQFATDYRCVLLGWPQGDPAIVSDLIATLTSPDHQDLPLLIVCQEETPEVSALVKRRARSRSLLWKHYQTASEIIDRLPVVRVAAAPEQPKQSVGIKPVIPTKTALLVDSAPSISHTLHEMMEINGYRVAVAPTAATAGPLIDSGDYDLIVADYHLFDDQPGEHGLESFCEAVRQKNAGTVVAVVSAKYTDAVIKHSLTVGAATCLFKSESTGLLFARIDALTKNLLTSKRVNAVTATPEKSQPVQAQLKQVQAPPAAVRQTVETTGAEKPQPEVASKKSPNGRTEPAVATPANSKKVQSEAEKTKHMNVFRSGQVAASPATETPETVVRQARPIDKAAFNKSLADILRDVADNTHGNIRYSVLMLDVQLVAATGDRLSIGDSAPMRDIVLQRLSRLYKRENSLSYLGDGQFAFILANRRIQDALMLTSKVLEVVPKMVRYLNNMELVSHAAIFQLDGKSTESEALLKQCRAACARTRKDQRDNCALVLPMRKYLTALVSQETA